MADGFQPKFVDLVRNTTTTVGTGNFTLGAAAAGFTSFTAALQVGDSFYYSAIGVDKPAEHEVGRGTLLAGGVISRDPVNGGKTDFSNGAKSISLIAAAEWYQAAEQLITSITPIGQELTSAASTAAVLTTLGIGGAGLETVSRFPVAIGDRASLAAYSATSTAYLRERGREGMFVWAATDLSALVLADVAQGIYVAPSSDPTGASGGWVRKFNGPINPEWFGVAPGSSGGVNGIANSNAFSMMQAVLRARGVAGFQARGVERIQFPSAGTYEFASTIELTDGSWLLEGAGAPSDEAGTLLKFPQGVTGIRVQRANTSGAAATRAPGETADASIIRNLRLKGAFTGTEADAHGIHLRASARLEKLVISDFEGDGVYAFAVAGSGGANEGNANVSFVERLRIIRCRTGLFIDGADTNAWTVIGIDCSANRRWGIWDSSFLGNTYLGCHADSNGIIPGVPGSVVSYSGNLYCVKFGQDGAASTNAPSGTSADNNWWYYMGAGGANPALNIGTWTSGATYRSGGSYLAEGSGNANNLFSGCYHESAQGLAQIASPALVCGGSMRPFVRGVPCLYGSPDAICSDSGFTARGNFMAMGANHSFGPQSGTPADNVFYFDNTNANNFLFFRTNLVAQGFFQVGAGSVNVVAQSGSVRLGVNGVGDVAVASSTGLSVSGALTATGAIGYGAGAGGAVAQASAKSAAVTLNKACGQITLNAAALPAGTDVSFTVTNNQVGATDTIELALASGNAAPGTYNYQVDKVAAGSFVVWLKNISSNALSEALVFNFAVKKGVAA